MAEGGRGSELGTAVGRTLLGILAILGAALVCVGLVAVTMYAAKLSPDDLKPGAPFRVMAAELWTEFKYLIQWGSILIAAIAFAFAVGHIKTVAKLVSDFIQARGPIYSLGTTITQVERSVQSLATEVDRLSKLSRRSKQLPRRSRTH